MKPVAIDLFCGLGGWTEGLLAAGYDVIGFDNERHEYGEHRYPAQLVLQDVRTIDGSRFAGVDLIVASPPCQEFSYMAMPWTRAKQIARALRNCGDFPEGYTGSRTLAELTELFGACFRIQAEASAAAGRHVPLVVENVNGAQPWVGRSRWNFGSFHLWGDVPALMPPTNQRVFKGAVTHRAHGTTNFHGRKNAGGSWFNVAHNTTSGKGQNPDGRKNPGIELGDIGFNVASTQQFGHMVESVKIKRSAEDVRQHIGVKRKFAAAMVAKIPIELSLHIARAWKPEAVAA